MKKRILFLTHEKFYPVTVGGTILNFEIAKAFVKKGYDVHIFSPISKEYKSKLKQMGMTLHSFMLFAPDRHDRSGIREIKYALYSITTFPYLLMLFLKYKFDLAFVVNFILAIPILVITKLFNSKFFIHYTNILCSCVEIKNLLFKKIINAAICIEINTARFSDCSFMITRSMEKEFLRHGIPQSKLHPIYYSVIFNTSIAKTEKNLENILYVGSLERYQGLDILIKAFSKLKKSYPKLQLDIIGIGRCSTEISKIINDLGIEDKVNLIGFVPHDKVINYISKAKICVVPYRKNLFTDTTIFAKMFEYGLLKKPVVCPVLESTEEFFSSDEVMFFKPENSYDLASKIEILLKNSKLRERLGQNLYNKIKKEFTMEKFLGRIFERIENGDREKRTFE